MNYVIECSFVLVTMWGKHKHSIDEEDHFYVLYYSKGKGGRGRKRQS